MPLSASRAAGDHNMTVLEELAVASAGYGVAARPSIQLMASRMTLGRADGSRPTWI